MPITNGDSATGGVPLLSNKEILPHQKALEILAEYKRRDGLSIDELLDSNKNGALTYNDFLVLPGFIGIAPSRLPALRD
jgi:IMP dehydrogenase